MATSDGRIFSVEILPGGLTFLKNEAFVMKIPVPILAIAFDKISKTFGLALA